MTPSLQLVWHARPADGGTAGSAGPALPPADWSIAGITLLIRIVFDPMADDAASVGAWLDAVAPHVANGPSVHVRAATWSEAWRYSQPLLWSLAAAQSGRSYLRGDVIQAGGRAHYLLVPVGAANPWELANPWPYPDSSAGGSHVLVDSTTQPVQATAFPAASTPVSDQPGDPGPVPVSGILIATDAGAGSPIGYITVKQARLLLAGAADSLPIYRGAGFNSNQHLNLIIGLLDRSHQALRELLAALPAYVIPSGSDNLPADFTLPIAPVGYSDDQLACLHQVQLIADSVYGRLESERAVAWAVEELGELAQAIRRGEGKARLSEEIGQLFSWVLCLGNICGIDIAESASAALWHEVMRQVQKYGKLRPYQPAARSWSAG